MDIHIPNYTVHPVALDAGQVTDWGHIFLRAAEYYRHTKGEGAIAFVLDTAGKFDHDDLRANALPQYDKNFTNDPDKDAHGHGHHCAGIIAGVDNDFGVIGIAPAVGVVAVKVLNDSGSGSFAWVAAAIRYVADLKLDPKDQGRAKIISLSLGGPAGQKSPDVLSDAIDYAIKKGVYIVASAGNSGYRSGGKSTVGAPGNHPDVITVAASMKPGDRRASYSSGGEETDVIAPGSSVFSTHKDNGYAYLSGTSMAGPQVAGVCALLLSRFNIVDQGGLTMFLRARATDVLEKGFDPESGWGTPILVEYEAEKGDPKPRPPHKPVPPGPEPDPGPERPDPNPDPVDPVPDPGPGPEPDPGPERPAPEYPKRGRGETTMTFPVAGSFGIMWGNQGGGSSIGIVNDLKITLRTDRRSIAAISDVVKYVGSFFLRRGLVLPAGYDMKDAAIYTGYFLQLLAAQDWVEELLGYNPILSVSSLSLGDASNVARVEVDGSEIAARIAEDFTKGVTLSTVVGSDQLADHVMLVEL